MVIIKKHFSPDAAVATGGTLPPKVKRIKVMPDGDSDFLSTADKVNTTWKANPQITLVYMTQSEFEATLSDYNTGLTTRQSKGSDRPSQTFTLKQVNATIDTAVTDVKTYIEKKYKKTNAQPQFTRFGITKQGGSFRMVLDKDERVKALPLMIKAIADDGFAAEEFGTAFWQDIQKKFTEAVDATQATDKTVTGSVSLKKQSRKQLEKVMKSLLKVLEGNYPDTFKAVIRLWGFLKQK